MAASHTPTAIPVFEAQAREDRATCLAAHRAGQPLSELPLVEVVDDRLARLLGELGRAVEARARAAQGARTDRDQRRGDGAPA